MRRAKSTSLWLVLAISTVLISSARAQSALPFDPVTSNLPSSILDVINPSMQEARAATPAPRPGADTALLRDLIDTIAGLRRELAQNPDDANGWIRLGQAYLEASERGVEASRLGINPLEGARDSFIEAVSLNYLSGDAHFGLGVAEYARGDFAAALFAFSEVSRLFPERFDGHFNRAVTLLRLRRPEEAIDAFNTAISNDSQASDQELINAYLGLAGQLKRIENFMAAADAYSAALELAPGNPELLFLRSEALFEAGEGLEALADLSELDATSNDFRVSALIARIFSQQNQPERAQRALDRARRRAAESSDRLAEANILLEIGRLARDEGRLPEAIAELRQSVRLNPNAWEGHYLLGLSLLESGQPREARTALEDALALNRDRADIYLALATTYDLLNDPQTALRNAQNGLQRLQANEEATASELRFVQGRTLFRLQDFASAFDVLQRVVAEQPNNGQAHLWAGLAAYQLGDFSLAAQLYERAVQLSPESVEARINLGAAYLAAQRYEDAELVYQLFLAQNGPDAEVFFNLGWALLSQGRRQEARDAWQQAVRLDYPPARTALSEFF